MARSSRLTTMIVVLIPVAVGINYAGKFFAEALKLPLWLDSIGTVLAAMLAGPVVGGLSGAINNIIYGLTAGPISFIYALTSIGIGVAAGLLYKAKMFENAFRAFLSGLIIAVVATVISVPLNVIFWEGQTGNVWGDALFAFLRSKNVGVWLASFFDELVVDLVDKVLTVFIAYGIFKALPKSLVYSFRQEQ
ncbi:energy-coupling factor transport system substrate-specific component [Fervidobacterium changbaicum]|uniref:ECF transporter S component n=2 Tax=Fervidobacterium TaxID=2422 RepID=A0AAI8CMQ5_FERIS|nr:MULTISPECIES: ECF transporter S component [Fervidobacterium]AMW33245.1 ECF transporter S component [Fervidobacterium islandicum]QAV33306.1 ECF transporter S component [Fervidobacterium changbaicum]SDH08139.1 energy-coupling factor transport system substrate-specific component [Fervidobacterium changbaicum]